MAAGLDSLFDDIPRATPAPSSAPAQPAPAGSDALDALFDDVPRTAAQDFRPGMYENGRLVAPSGNTPSQAPSPALDMGNEPLTQAGAPMMSEATLAEIQRRGGDAAPVRSGGAGIDRLIGSTTGMLSGAESYDLKKQALADADARVSRMSQIDSDIRVAPQAEFVERNPLFEMNAAQRAGEQARTGVPVPVSPMEPVIDPAQQADANRAREIGRAEDNFTAALKKRNEVNTAQPQAQGFGRNAAESIAAGIVGIPAGIIDAGSIVARKIAEYAEAPDVIADIDRISQSVQSYANGLARPDAARKDEFGSQAFQGIGSTFGFGLAGALGKVLGMGAKATTALAGALPQASQMYRDAEAKKASETDKWLAFAAGLGLGATEALPIANAMERWAHQVPGFHQAFRNTMVSMAEEATQEFGQKLGENIVAGATYDPKRAIGEGVIESAAVGGLTGGVLGGAGSFGSAALRGPQADTNLGMPLPTMPQVEVPAGVPQGALPASTLLGPDPSMQQDQPASATPPRGAALRDMLADSRTAAEIRAEMQQDGRIAAPPPEAAPPPPTGQRNDPVRIETPDHVTQGAERTATPSAAQAEAGNYTKRHVNWNGLDISIETEAGSDRTGVAPDGTPWSVTLPAPYGYIKRTKGADGDQLDVYVGPNPQGSVFVVDQVDPQTARFDEHKVMLGFDSEEQARAFYDAGFSDGSGPARTGAIRQMSAAQFKQWANNANLKRPLAYKPPMHAGLSQQQFRDLRAVVRDTSQSLDPSKLAPALGAKPADVAAVLGRMTETNEVRMGRDGRFGRVPRRGGIADLMQFIGWRGGINPQQAREVQDLNKVFVPGYGRIVRATGRPLDEIREMAVEAGYLPEDASINDLLDAIEWSTRGRKTFSTHDEQSLLDQQEQRAGAAAELLNARFRTRFQQVADSMGLRVGEAEIAEASRLVEDQRMTDEQALEEAVERLAIQEIEGAYDRAQEDGNDEILDALLGRHPEFFGATARDGAVAADAGRQGQEDVAGEAQGSAPAGQQSRGAGVLPDGWDEGHRAGASSADREQPVAGREPGQRSAVEPVEESAKLAAADRIKEMFDAGLKVGDVQKKLRSEGARQPEVLKATREMVALEDAAREVKAAPAPRASEEPGAEGKPQAVIPGAERIGQGEQAQRAADKPMQAKKPQAEVGGMFDEGNTSAQLFDAPQSQALSAASQSKTASPESLSERADGDTEASGNNSRRKAVGISGVGGVNVEADGGSRSPPSDAASSKSGLDIGPATGADLRRNLLKAHPGLVEGLGMLDIEAKRSVMGLVSSAAHNFKVREFIIEAVPVDVMNDIVGSEVNARRLLNNKTMLADALAAVDPDAPVFSAMVSAILSAPAAARAEVSSGTKVDAAFADGDTAPIAGESDRSQKPSSYGKTNKVFTSETAERARALLKQKLSGTQLNSGIDPETIQAGITLAGWHIESGSRQFAAYTAAMVEDLGDAIRPYLRSFYESVRHYPGFDSKGMSNAAEIEAVVDEAPKAIADQTVALDRPKTASKNDKKIDQLNAPRSDGKSDRETIAEAMRQELVNGASYKTIREARALAEKATGGAIKPSTETAKLIDEAVELGVVLAARDIVAEGQPAGETFDRLVKLYGQQPTLGVRTSTSMIEQAYSTPVPLAYVASRLAGIDQSTTVYEPSAGNGALLIEANPSSTVANELNQDRAAALRAQGFDVETQDASTIKMKATFDAVIANPPFGVVKDAAGRSRSFKVDDRYSTNEIDHAIALRALAQMNDDGRAVLIVGGPNKLASTPAQRSDAYNGKAKREFYLTLYGEYNVVDHFTVSGDLYLKQGAGYPVDVIVIDGRGKSLMKVPAAQVPPVLTTWQDIKGKLNDTETTGSTRREAGDAAGRDAAAGSQPGLRADAGRVDGGRSDTSGVVEQSARRDEPGRADRSSERAADRPAELESERRVQPGASSKDGAGVQRRPSVAQQAQPSLFDTDSNAETAPALEAAPQPKPRQAPAPAMPAAADMSKPQVPYRPRSNAKGMGTLVPVNMQTTSQDALTALEKRVGNIDDYVARELGYTADELKKYFGAEQVDGIALGIDNFAKNAGLIIGDQTGIGKGRQVAGILRWALRQGRVPIFVTEKPNLYADMFRDLSDIGVATMLGRDIKIFMTNSGERVPLDDDGKKVLTSPQAGPHQAAMNKMVESGKLDGYDMVFTTYAQMQTVKGEETSRQKFLRAMAANNSVITLDEAHNAGGQAQQRVIKKDGKEPITRAKFVRELLALSSAALYSSATYAKRPDVMDLYFKTDMALAVDDISKLGDLILRGGIPMQQIVAAQLSKAGQYVRRERSFDGIVYDTPVVEVDTEKYEEFSRNIALIQQFSENFVKDAAAEIDQRLKEEGQSSVSDSSTGSAGASSTNFTAVMHNIINQLLLSMKAQAAADMAIDGLKNGMKPVITLANTNEAFIEEYADGVGAEVGSAINIRFNDVLQRYLDRSRTLTIKKPFAAAGETERYYLTDKDLGPMGARAYEEAKAAIADADFAGLPVSPIDWIRSQIAAAGFSVSEITGRSLTLDYGIKRDGNTDVIPPRPTLKIRPGAEKSIAGRRAAIGGFNSGKIDVLILNQSGSTGLSLHASERVTNQNKRLMILAQAENNIDTHMQMLGRVNRTGQVVKPEYRQLVAGIPAEKRPASILSKKMASLNANTTGARDSAVTAKDTPDFMNDYGDRIAAIVMRENPDINVRLGEPVSAEAESWEGAMRKVTGRIPLLPLAEQESLYDLLQSEYEALIKQLEASGQNALEAKTLEIDARTIGTMQVKEGKNADSPFADAVYFEQVDAKRLGKPMKPDEVVEAVAKAIGIDIPDRNDARGRLEKLAQVGAAMTKDVVAAGQRNMAAFKAAERLRIKKDDAQKQSDTKLDDIKVKWTALAQTLAPGQGVKLMTDEGNFYGIVVKTEFSGRAKNPLALSAWRAQIALADPARSITLPFSQMHTERTMPEKTGEFDIQVAPTNTIGSMSLLDAFEDMQAERREERVIVTGNILAGYDFVGGKGQIVNFADDQGRLRQGIIMRRDFNAEKFLTKKAVVLKTGQQVQTYLDRVAKSIVTSSDKFIRVRKAQNGDTQIAIDAARQNGGRYFLARPVLDAARRDFVKTANEMRLEVPPYRAAEVLDAIMKAGAVFEVNDNLDVAREISGQNLAFSPSPRGWDVVDAVPPSEMTQADRDYLTRIIAEVAGSEFAVTFPKRIDVAAGTPAAKAWGKQEQAFEAGGYYDWANDVIAVSQRIGSPQTAYHEAFHRLQTRALTKQQIAVLEAAQPALRAIVAGSILGRDVDQMSSREVEADAFSIFALARDAKTPPQGFPAQVRAIWDKVYRLIRAVTNAMKGRGLQTYEDVFEKAWRGDMAAAADAKTGGVEGPLLSLSVPPGAQDTVENRKSLMMQAIGKGQPLDRAMRIPFDWFGGLDHEGRWQPGIKLDETAKRVIVDSKINPEGRFGFMAGIVENARAGLIDRYGLDPDYVKRDRGRANDERAVLSEGKDIIEQLMKREMSVEEAQVLQAMLTGEAVSEGDIGKLAEPIRVAIDQLGAEAVSLGLLSAESFERHRGAYLHRVYAKDVADTNNLVKFVDRVMTSRRKKIIGDQFKGRGIFLDVGMERLLQDDPEFHAGARGTAAKGERFRLIQRFTVQKNTDGTETEKETKRIWWPADRDVPAKWKADRDGGTWEVRGVAGGKAVLWRDYTKAERTKMGEILDARYTIGKTYSMMAHDLANGRFFKDIAEREDWSQSHQPPDGTWLHGEGKDGYSRAWNDRAIEWVKVPDAEIPNSGGKKRWGALAGRFVRAEIWRDLNETAIAQNPSTWRRLYGIWKGNKTFRSPVTHMNNIMSNLMFMDMADIRMQDLARGIQSFLKKDQVFREASDNGAFGNDMMAIEFRNDVLKPLLEELTAQQTTNGASNPFFARAAFAGKMANTIWDAVKTADKAMIDAYRIEDEIFRMATFIRRREFGDSAQEAADFARRQFLDYDIKAPWIAAARNTVLPFVSYPYRAIPLIAQALAYRPWKLAKYFAVTYAMNALAYGLDGDGDEDRERASLRKDEQGYLWTGTPRMMRMPWRDANGLPVFLDIRRWTPAGDIFDAGQGSSALPIPAPLMPGGPIMLGAEFALNKIGFTGKTITNDRTDEWWDSGTKLGDWAWKSVMPNAPWVPGSWSGERIGKAWVGGTDRAGNPLSLKEAVSSSFGVKLAGRDIDQGFTSKFYDIRKSMQDMQQEARTLARQRGQNLISQPVFERELAEIIRKRQKIAGDAAELGQKAKTKAKETTE